MLSVYYISMFGSPLQKTFIASTIAGYSKNKICLRILNIKYRALFLAITMILLVIRNSEDILMIGGSI